MKKEKQNTEEQQKPQPVINRKARRAMKRRNRRTQRNTEKLVTDDEVKVKYHDDSYKDKTKKVFSSGMKFVKERLASKNKHYDLPEKIDSVRHPMLTTCVVINRDGRERQLLPDVPSCHKILVHGCVAKEMVSKVCILVRITDTHSKETDEFLDGNWAITPAEWRMINATTIQHVRRRRWFWLRRYWYEISFDGRVQPAHMLFDYDMDPLSKKTRFWITREYVPVAKTDKLNDYFRFWKKKPAKQDDSSEGSAEQEITKTVCLNPRITPAEKIK